MIVSLLKNTIISVLEERAVFYREKGNGLYTTLPFLLANTAVNIPFLAACTILYSSISYFAVVCLSSLSPIRPDHDVYHARVSKAMLFTSSATLRSPF
jgi:hypothetical protein